MQPFDSWWPLWTHRWWNKNRATQAAQLGEACRKVSQTIEHCIMSWESRDALLGMLRNAEGVYNIVKKWEVKK